MVCVDCCLTLNQNRIPFRSIANNLDVGVVPEVISSLTPFESIFIRLAICYQTIAKLAPSGAGVPCLGVPCLLEIWRKAREIYPFTYFGEVLPRWDCHPKYPVGRANYDLQRKSINKNLKCEYSNRLGVFLIFHQI